MTRTEAAAESLSLRAEKAWLRITEQRAGGRLFAYLDSAGHIALYALPPVEPEGVRIGAGQGWCKAARLTVFRDAVFAAFEQQRRGR